MSVAAAVAAALAGSGCRRDAPAPAASADPAAAHRLRVVIAGPSGRESTVVAEVARTDAERERGLMYRQRLGDGEGMLFVFDRDAEHAFWMKNTLIPLDMIFIDQRRRVVGVVEQAQPGSVEMRTGGVSRYVLEVIGGWAAAHEVRPGDRVTLEELR